VPEPDLDAAAVCTEPAEPWIPTNPPYAGPGPHPMKVVSMPEPPNVVSGLHNPLSPEYGSVDSRLLQLLVCIAVGKPGRPAGQVLCGFSNGSAYYSLAEATYAVTVREVRTGRVVARHTWPGTAEDHRSCPWYGAGTLDVVVLRALDLQFVQRELEPLLQSPVS
jgi:hypothetical protein